MTVLEPRDLRKTHRSRGRPSVHAVRGTDLVPHSGELLGLPGPSGCGRSTTLRMITGLGPETGGDILVDGASVVALPAQRGHTTILVTQNQEEALSLADRIAVMKDGVIQQLGTPYEIYDSPANVFVADFVREPAVNLLPSVADTEGHARLSGAVRIALPVAEGREVVVGVHPEDLPLTGDAGIPAKVVAHEPLPEAGIATLAHGERVRVTADPDHTHAFDAKTGAPRDERIRACRRRWRPLHPAVAHHGGTRP